MIKRINDGLRSKETLFSTNIATRWADMDADGRINNLIILRYAEEARMQWAASLDLNTIAPDMMPVVATVSGQFLAPIGYPCLLTIEISCSRLGKSSLQLQFGIYDSVSPHMNYATATATWVWVNKATNKPTLMPQALRDYCTSGFLSD